MEFQFCNKCGSQVPRTAKFCNHCGAPVLKLETRQPAPAPDDAPPATEQIEQNLSPIQIPCEDGSPLVLTLDTLDAPPAPKKTPVVFTLDSLPDETPAQTQVVPTEPQVHNDVPVATPKPTPAAPMAPTRGILSHRGVGRTILAVFLCILIFVWSFATLSVLNLRLATTGEQGVNNIETALSRIDFNKIPASMVFIGLDDQNYITLSDIVVQAIEVNYPGQVDVDPDELKEFWETSMVIPFLSEKLSECLTDLYSDSTAASISENELKQLLQENAKPFEEAFGEKLSDSKIDAIIQTAEKTGALKLFNTESLKQARPQAYRIAQIALSWWVIGILGVIFVLLILLLQAANHSVLRTCRDTGITLMVVSGIWGLCGLFVMLLPKVWGSMLQAIHPIEALMGALLQGSLIPTAAAFGTGVILVLIQVIGKIIVVKSAQKRTV